MKKTRERGSTGSVESVVHVEKDDVNRRTDTNKEHGAHVVQVKKEERMCVLTFSPQTILTILTLCLV